MSMKCEVKHCSTGLGSKGGKGARIKQRVEGRGGTETEAVGSVVKQSRMGETV
jgi:hypothetical protein